MKKAKEVKKADTRRIARNKKELDPLYAIGERAAMFQCSMFAAMKMFGRMAEKHIKAGGGWSDPNNYRAYLMLAGHKIKQENLLDALTYIMMAYSIQINLCEKLV